MLCCVMENMEKAEEMVSRCVFAKKTTRVYCLLYHR